MESPKEKYFAPINNFAALKEINEDYKSNSSKKELEDFLIFWQDTYDVWKVNYSPFEDRFTQEKVRVRKSLIKILGVRS